MTTKKPTPGKAREEQTAPKAEPKPAPITGEQEVAALKAQLLDLLRGNTEVVESKTANRIAELRVKLRSLGATDIP